MNVFLILEILIVIFMIMLSYYNKNKDNILYKIVFGVIIIIMLLLLCLRSVNVGTDLITYIKLFTRISSHPLNFMNIGNCEIGYKFLNFIISFFTNDIHLFISIVSIIIMVPLAFFVYKESKYPLLSLLLYISLNFYAFTFSGLRQAIAISLLFISFKFIKERKIIYFLLLVILASLFHTSAFVFLPAYFIYKIKINKLSLSLFALFDIIIYIFRKSILLYFINNYYNDYEVLEILSYNWLLMCVALVVICACFYNRIISKNTNTNGLFIICITGLSLMLFTSVSNNALRIANYYYMFIILLVPEVIYYQSKSKNKLLLLFVFIIISLMLFYYLLDVNGYGILPYSFYWQ